MTAAQVRAYYHEQCAARRRQQAAERWAKSTRLPDLMIHRTHLGVPKMFRLSDTRTC